MLGFNPYYYQTTRRSVICFGNLFKDVVLVKYNAITRDEISRRIVPLTYAPKENYIKRLLQNPEPPATVEIKLPAMSFELTSLEYNAQRKLQSSLQNFNQLSPGDIASQYMGVPYDLKFTLYIYIRNIDDGLQIVEQILPFFNPDYTLTMDFIDDMNITRNVPIILNNVQTTTDYEGDAIEERRIVWQLDFTMQTTFYGPTNIGGLITETITNLNQYAMANGNELVLSTSNTPFGYFSSNETVYQGEDITDATAVGKIISYNSNGQMTITITSGEWLANVNVHGSLYGGSVNVTAIPSELRFAVITDRPLPNTANSQEDFGFTATIVEYPEAGYFTPPSGSGGGEGSGGEGISGGSGGGSGGGLFSDAYNQANNAYSQANLAFTQANTAVSIAELAYAEANNASGNNSTFGTITSNVVNISTVADFTTSSGSIVANGATYVLDSFSGSVYNTVKYIAQLAAPGLDGGTFQATEVLCMQDGTNTYMTEYATLLNSVSLGYFSTTITGSTFQFSFVTFNLSNAVINYKIIREAITT